MNIGQCQSSYLGPVESDETHAQTMNISKHLVDGDVVWRNPANPREVGEGLEEVPWHDIPDPRAKESVEEESLSADTTAVTNTSICLCMESVEKGAGDKVIRPDYTGELELMLIFFFVELTHGWWLHQETTGDTTNGETDKLSGHNDHPLIYAKHQYSNPLSRVMGHTAEVVGLIVEDTLDSNDIGGVSTSCTNGGHDR